MIGVSDNLQKRVYNAITDEFIVKTGLTNGTETVDIMPTNGSYGLVTIQPNHISINNSTTALLNAGETFTGIQEEITNYAIIFVNVYSDVASATDGLCLQFSTDGVNWDAEDFYTIAANTGKTFSIQSATKYFRVLYENGTSDQTDFRLQVKLNTSNALDSSHRIADAISSQDDATLNKSVLTAQQPDTTFINIGATESGNLKTTDAENPLAIAKGEVVGTSYNNKWGNAKDFDASDGEVDIWDGTEDGEPYEAMTYTFSTTAAIDSISSESTLDVYDLTIEGLDSNFNEVTQTKTLNGQNRVALDTPLIRVNRAYNDNGIVFIGHVFIFENDTLSGGVPDTPSLIRAIVHPEDQQTEMAIYTVPAGKTGYILGGYMATSGANKSSNYIIRLKFREFNKIFRTKQKVSISDTGTSYIQYDFAIPEIVPEKTDIKTSAEMTAVGGTKASVSAGFSIVLIDN